MPFNNYNRAYFGGTEYMVSQVRSRFIQDLPKFNDYYSFSIPGIVNKKKLKEAEKDTVIVWLHNLIQELTPDIATYLITPKYVKNIKYFIVVSEYHKKEVLKISSISEEKVLVIPNAIDPVPFDGDKFFNVDKVKIIHTSSPERGMDYLLMAVKEIDFDFQLDVFNSIDPNMLDIHEDYRHFFEDPRVSFYGKTPKQTVLKHLAKAHIHAYPSIHTETSCLSQIEALSAGCLTVHSNSGALPESSLGFGVEFNIDPYRQDVAKGAREYAKLLRKAIVDIKNGSFAPRNQPSVIEEKFSWSAAGKKWQELHDRL